MVDLAYKAPIESAQFKSRLGITRPAAEPGIFKSLHMSRRRRRILIAYQPKRGARTKPAVPSVSVRPTRTKEKL